MKMLLLSLWLLFAVAATGATATLSWNPNTEDDLAGYRVYYGPASRHYTNMVDVGNVTTNRVTGLVKGVVYYFAVTAYNTAGAESDYSLEVSFYVPEETAIPVDITATRLYAIAVEWVAIVGNSYEVDSNIELNSWYGWLPVSTVTATNTAMRFTAIAEEPTRYYRVMELH